MRSCKEVVGRREGQTRGDTRGAEKVNQAASGHVKCANDGVHRGRHEPPRIRGERLECRILNTLTR